MNKNKKIRLILKNTGFTILEVLIACSIISIAMFALMKTAEKGLRISSQALDKSQASFLIEEGAEAVKTIRNDNWLTISDLVLDVPYYLSFDNNTKKWNLTNTNSLIDDIFTRSVVFSAAERDSNDDLVLSGGNVDSGTKKVTVSVSWDSPTGSISKSLSFYISDIFN